MRPLHLRWVTGSDKVKTVKLSFYVNIIIMRRPDSKAGLLTDVSIKKHAVLIYRARSS